MTGANFSVTSEGGVPYSKLHHPNSIILFMPIVDTASCDWRHALHRLIGILNWKTAVEKCKYRHPENCHTKTMNKCVNSNPSQRHEMLTMLKYSLYRWLEVIPYKYFIRSKFLIFVFIFSRGNS